MINKIKQCPYNKALKCILKESCSNCNYIERKSKPNNDNIENELEDYYLQKLNYYPKLRKAQEEVIRKQEKEELLDREEKKIKVYLAGSYTNPDPCINTHKTIKMADEIMEIGYTVFIPHLTHFWHTVSPKPYRKWLEYDKEWLRVCDEMWIMPNSEKSNGVKEEIKFAKKHNINVHYITNKKSECCRNIVIEADNKKSYCLECRKDSPETLKESL